MSSPRLYLVLLASAFGAHVSTAQNTKQAHVPERVPQAVIAQIEASLIRYPACKRDVPCLECAVVPVQVGNQTLTEYFRQVLPLSQTQALSGMVLVNVDIDAEGVPCCSSIQNYTASSHAQVQALHLDQVVAGMPRWRVVRTDEGAVSSSTCMRLVFSGQSGLQAEPFFTGGLHPQLLDTLGVANNGWYWVKAPKPLLPLQAGEYVQFEFGIDTGGRIHSIKVARTNTSVAQGIVCRQALETAILQPIRKIQQKRGGYYSFVGK